MSELNHVAENLLEKVRSGKLDVTPQMITVLLEFLDTVKLMLQNIVDGVGEADGVTNIESLKAKIKAIAEGNDINTVSVEKKEEAPKTEEKPKEESKASSSNNMFHIEMIFKPSIFDNGIDPLMFLNDLKAIGTVSNLKIDISNVPAISDLEDPYACYTQFSLDIETASTIEQVQNIFLFVIDDNDINITEKVEEKVEETKAAEEKVEEKAEEKAEEKHEENWTA